MELCLWCRQVVRFMLIQSSRLHLDARCSTICPSNDLELCQRVDNQKSQASLSPRWINLVPQQLDGGFFLEQDFVKTLFCQCLSSLVFWEKRQRKGPRYEKRVFHSCGTIGIILFRRRYLSLFSPRTLLIWTVSTVIVFGYVSGWMAFTSVARTYANVNEDAPRSYWDYGIKYCFNGWW